MNRKYLFLGLFLVGQYLGCDLEKETATFGELGVARFAWDKGYPECTSDCNAAEPMASRSFGYLMVVNTTEIPSFHVSSSNPEVVRFSNDPSYSYQIRAEAQQSGDSMLILTGIESSETIDRFEVKVRDVARISTLDPDLFKHRFTIVSGGKKYVFFRLEDDDGNNLFGIGGVDYRVADGLSQEQVELVRADYDPGLTYFGGSFNEMVSVSALSLGSGSLVTEAASGAFLSMPMSIVDESVITRISLHSVTYTGDSTADVVTVYASAWSEDEPVHSPNCAWSLESDIGHVDITSQGRDTVQFLKTRATVNVTCTIGPHTASLEVVMH